MNTSVSHLENFFPSSVMFFFKTLESEMNCSAYFVGGSVRDAIIGKASHDFDVELFDIYSEGLTTYLEEYGCKFTFAGNNFPVWNLSINNYEVQIALPRIERKAYTSENAYKDFVVTVDPNMSILDAAKRRDFTMNSIYMSTEFEIFDYYGGIKDLENGVLQPTSEQFCDDPLRIYRAMRFLSQFDLFASETLLKYAVKLFPLANNLEKDVIAKEWLKWSVTRYPQNGIEFLKDCGWITLYPELAILSEIDQSPIHHPEGNVFNHTLLVLKEIGQLTESNSALTFAALLHDTGKAVATATIDGKITSVGHEEFSAEFVIPFFEKIHPNFFSKYYAEVSELCLHHMSFHNIEEISQRTIRRKISKLKYTNFYKLSLLIACDLLGRKLSGEQIMVTIFTVKSLLNCYGALKVSENVSDFKSIVRVIDGDFLISKGLIPGKSFGSILAKALDAQLNEELTIENREEWFKKFVEN